MICRVQAPGKAAPAPAAAALAAPALVLPALLVPQPLLLLLVYQPASLCDAPSAA
jgi:hypothetical protein